VTVVPTLKYDSEFVTPSASLFPCADTFLTSDFLLQYYINTFTMAEATAADGQMKNLKISEVKKSKKDGAPKTAAKKPQQQKKKVRYTW
jgi:hypothetical protein